ILISGSVVIFIIYWWQFINEFTFEIIYFKEHTLIIHVILAYGIGLICFSGGRTLRRFLLKRFTCNDEEKRYAQKIDDHKLNNDIDIKRYLSLGDSSINSLREFLWSNIRQNNDYGYSKSFLNKYWSMSVIFDSLLGCSFFLDIALIDFFFKIFGAYEFKSDYPIMVGLLILFSSLSIKYFFIKMASIYDRYQNDELLASYAALIRKREYDSSTQRP
ncbi:hypothetical protein, partial [Sphingobacterium faecium]|uniref:hypothetical protein n=1 Tax=Sphingobacterium faecium TaxID=34087 RepID=UPI001884D8C2